MVSGDSVDKLPMAHVPGLSDLIRPPGRADRGISRAWPCSTACAVHD
jgi:hypothetical protein